MNSVKCRACGLINFASEDNCKRCGGELAISLHTSTGSTSGTKGITFGKLAFIAALAVAGYFFYSTYFMSSSDPAEQMSNSTRLSDLKTSSETRAELDRQRSQRVANAVGAAPGLNAHENRTRETDRLMNQISNSAVQR
ncbi:hypothetical protein [Leptolyngbya sp. 7M]|uniref:hypothetical protein n=1 Tax=Leptolyngbya sp. 7M TaxID=2812896 RepID=UPI001B8C3A74|nr:hypothetical protein [Leptolyngbya sp. 7M]QYO68243.1 hypothetical protein JVX88_16640 [Leptolyngbya sp. 7M]